MIWKFLFAAATAAAVSAPALASPTLATPDAETFALGKLSPHVVRPLVARKPVAFGAVYQDGTVESGSGNFTAVWNPSSQWYQVTITGVNYYYLSYATTITTSTPIGNGTCQSDSVSGNLLVRCYTLSGVPTQATFGFITY